MKLNRSFYLKIFLFIPIFFGITSVFVQPARSQHVQSLQNKSLLGIASPQEVMQMTGGKCNQRVMVGLFKSFISATETIVVSGIDENNRYVNQTCEAETVLNSGDQNQINSFFRKIQNNKNGGVLAGVQNVNALLIQQRPYSGSQFFQDKIYAIENFGKVGAQSQPAFYYPGTGFDLLRPMQGFWGWSVNVVYSFMIIIIIGVALAIIFRANLPGGTTVTIQSAIPNIAMAMILIPLSYAISGVFIDFVTLGTNVTHQFLFAPGSPAQVVYDNRGQIPSDFGGRERIPTPDAGEQLDPRDRGLFADDPRVNVFNARNGVAINEEINAAVNGSATGDALNNFFLIKGLVNIFSPDNQGWIGEVINFVVSIILLLTGLRIFVILIEQLLTIIFLPVFSPFIFATVAIPGNGTKAIVNYLKTLGAFSAIYVTCYAMILLSIICANGSFQASIPDIGTTGYIPPMLGIDDIIRSLSQRNIDTTAIGFVLALLAVAIYLNIPKTLNAIKAAWVQPNPLIGFLTDAYTSAQESVNLGRRMLAAPGQALTGARMIASAPRNAQNQVDRLTARGLQSVRNYADIIRGRTPGEQNTSLFRRRKTVSDNIGALEVQRQAAIQAGNSGEARRLQGQIDQQKRLLTNLSDAAGGEANKEFKSPSLKADWSWGGQPGPISLTEGQINDLRAKIAAGENSVILMGGKIVLKAENFKLTPYIVTRVFAHSIIPSTLPVDDYSAGPQIGPGPIAPTPVPPPPAVMGAVLAPINTSPLIFQFPPGVANHIQIAINPSDHADFGGSSMEIKVDLHIRNIQWFLNNVNPNNLAGTNKIKFRVRDAFGPESGNVDSNPFDIKLTRQF